METDKIPALSAEIQALLAERLHVRARSLPLAVDKARRLLPRRLHRDARALAEADSVAGHPRLRRQVDLAAVERAHAALAHYLRSIDPAARRRARVLGFLAFLALVVLLAGAGIVGWMRWRGLV